MRTLQWGLVLLDEESRDRLRGYRDDREASMGPRLVRRGKRLPVVCHGARVCRLQWGLVLLDEERTQETGKMSWIEGGFNGASSC